MATLKPTLTLTSTDATSDALNFTITDVLTIGAPTASLTRISVLHTGATQLYADASADGTVYFFLHNVSTANFIRLKTDAGSNFGIINPGEFAFLGIDKNEGIEVQADTASCILEYAYWTKS